VAQIRQGLKHKISERIFEQSHRVGKQPNFISAFFEKYGGETPGNHF
jgi:hypothetical protein